MLRTLKAAVFSFALLILASVAAMADPSSDLRTPPPAPTPHLNGPKVYGVRPGHPFLYRIPCTGKRPIAFSAQKLPRSLKLDPNTGIISGTAPAKAGSFTVTLQASNSLGHDQRTFKIVVGETIGLTPQMG